MALIVYSEKEKQSLKQTQSYGNLCYQPGNTIIFLLLLQGFSFSNSNIAYDFSLIGIKKGIVNGTLLFKIAIYGLFLFLLYLGNKISLCFWLCPFIAFNLCRYMQRIGGYKLSTVKRQIHFVKETTIV